MRESEKRTQVKPSTWVEAAGFSVEAQSQSEGNCLIAVPGSFEPAPAQETYYHLCLCPDGNILHHLLTPELPYGVCRPEAASAPMSAMSDTH